MADFYAIFGQFVTVALLKPQIYELKERFRLFLAAEDV